MCGNRAATCEDAYYDSDTKAPSMKFRAIIKTKHFGFEAYLKKGVGIMAEFANEMPNQNNCDNQAANYLDKAAEACAAGDLMLGMHLYLAAYEQSVANPGVSRNVEIAALHEAWHLACDLKERSLAEYVFEKLEPFLTGEEISECAIKLQQLAFDRLEEYGFSHEELEDIAESFSQGFLDGDGAHIVKVESISFPGLPMSGMESEPTADAVAGQKKPEAEMQSQAVQQAETEDHRETAEVSLSDEPDDESDVEPEAKPAKPSHVNMNVAKVPDFNPYEFYYPNSVGKSYHAATTEGSGAYVFTRDEDRAHALERAEEAKAAEEQAAKERMAEDHAAKEAEASQATEPVMQQAPANNAQAVTLPKPLLPPETQQEAVEAARRSDVLTYDDLTGFDEAVSVMRDLGVGLQADQGFLDFVRMLNNRHGLDRMPALDTLLFRAPVIEDASRFVEATAGELGLPVLRMTIEENLGSMPMLCVSTNGNNRPRMNHAHNRFEGPAILVIEDLAMWALPAAPAEAPEGIAAYVMANMSRGAREAISLIRSAVDDPDVFVLVTSTTIGEVDSFFYDLLTPITVIDLDNPNEAERRAIWGEIARDQPSTREINRDDLVRFSAGMSRYDIYMAAREAVEDAYKQGLVQRRYLPVTAQNLFDKLASCQPVDSDEYRALEEAVIDEFRAGLDDLENLLP